MTAAHRVRRIAATFGGSIAVLAGVWLAVKHHGSTPICAAAGCKPALCTAELRGNLSDLVPLDAGCGALGARADAGAESDPVLAFHGTSSKLAALEIAIDLGASPAPGVFSAATVARWSIVAKSRGHAGCELRAGSGSVPRGSFTLSLTALKRTSGGVPHRDSAHGSLTAALYVHAPPGTDCGPGEAEHLAVSF